MANHHVTLEAAFEEQIHGQGKARSAYVRVSTDSQTVENQIRELRQVAERRGWEVIGVYNDAGISGAKGRNGRPGLDSMLKDASRRRFDVVMAWAIDRLGRSLTDLLHIIQHLEACGVDLYLDQQSIDTTTPMGKLVFQLTGAFAEFERTMIKQRVKAGLKRAVAHGVKLGRPKLDSATERKVRRQLAKGTGILKTAKLLGLGTGTVQRISRELHALR
jgi:DNA invertase Pin-like site-specific DNA recombinase